MSQKLNHNLWLGLFIIWIGLQSCSGVCNNGYFGDNCQQLCSMGCKICNSAINCSVCLDLFHRTDTNFCVARKLTAVECLESTTCACCNVSCTSSDTGICNDDCKNGYHGARCGSICPQTCIRCTDTIQASLDVANCTLCRDGYYSPHLEYQCQLTCPAGCRKCTSATNCTYCVDGYYLTSYQCARCNETCLTCSSSTTCTSCKTGYYIHGGVCKSCSPLCHSCRSRDTCICSNGCFMNHCEEITGSCSYGCKENFTSEEVGKCDRCKGMTSTAKYSNHGDTTHTSWKYGYYCNETCSEHCQTMCDRISGNCTTCKPGFYGDLCGNKCPVNCLSTCHKETGQCDTCTDGYYGNNCTFKCHSNCKSCSMGSEVCSTCQDGLYGENCDNNCSDYCVLDKCNKLSGSCECKLGYTGEFCSNEFTMSTPGQDSDNTIPAIVTPAPVKYMMEAAAITSGGVILMLGVIGLFIWMYRRKKGCFHEETSLIVTFKASANDEAKVRSKLATVDAEMSKLAERKAQLESQLDHLEQRMPYKHTDRADVTSTFVSYETLQKRLNDEGNYSTIIL